MACLCIVTGSGISSTAEAQTDQEPFVTIWKTDIGFSSDDRIIIPGEGENYTIEWTEVEEVNGSWVAVDNPNTGSETGSGEHTITFPEPGAYRVEISGNFTRIAFGQGGSNGKILLVEQWGDIQWSTMEEAFIGTENLNISATDAPDLSAVTSMRAMFRDATTLNADLSSWDVSGVTTMAEMFLFAGDFNGDLSGWNTGSVTNMSKMFLNAYNFNQDLSSWDVSSVITMAEMFEDALSFNGDISGWNPQNVTDMSDMFSGARSFNQDLSIWDVSSVTTMSGMFSRAGSFNGNLSGWNPQNVTDMSFMFSSADSFNQDLSSWNVSSVETMEGMFSQAESFNGDISTWNVSNVTDMSEMFSGATSFNQDLGSWDVSGVKNMASMFEYAESFNGNLSGWNPQNVTDMSYMFFSAVKYNQDLGSWNVSSVETMEGMFSQAESLNGDLSGWNPQNVTNMSGMFRDAVSFNQDIGSWDVSSVTNMRSMFRGAEAFNGNISGWNPQNVTDMSSMFSGATAFNQDLSNWDVSSVTNMSFMFLDAESFNGNIGTWDVSTVTDMSGMFSIGSFKSSAFNQDLSAWDVSSVENMASMFSSAESFNGDLSDWNPQNVTNMSNMFNNAVNFNRDISSWDVSSVTTMELMFWRATSFNQDLGSWDVSSVKTMNRMFANAKSFNGNINGWNPKNVTNMAEMFLNAISFNQDLGSWDVSSVENMASMFRSAESFNGDLSDWNPQNVTNTSNMFNNAVNFNRDIGSWNVSNVFTMNGMFGGADTFNQDLGEWDVSNVIRMNSMFSGADSFNGNIGNWDVSNVKRMAFMFFKATSFNQDLGGWNVSSVFTMEEMFAGAESFDQSLGIWNVSNVGQMSGMLSESALSVVNYDGTLTGWSEQSLQTNVELGASGLNYCGASEQRQTIIDEYNWEIFDDGQDCPDAGELAINPQRAGNLGPATIKVFGSDLTEDFNAVLSREDQPDIAGQTLLVTDNGTELEVRFDLTDQPTGTWDFVLTGPGGISQTLEDAFTIVEGEKPEVWANIQGANNILGGQSTTVNVNFGNRGNTDIHDVILFIRVPQEANISVVQNQMLGTAVDDWVDPGALDSGLREDLKELNPYLNVEGEGHTVMPLWYYRLPARSANTLSIQIAPAAPNSQTPLADSIEVEIAALSIENDFARTGNFDESQPLLLSGMITKFLETAANSNQKSAGMRSASFSKNPSGGIASLNQESSCNSVKPELDSAEDIEKQIQEDRSKIVETGRNLVNPTNVAQGLVIGIGTAAICGVTFGTPCLAATGIGLLNEANTLYQAYEAADEELSDEEKEQVEEDFRAKCREKKEAPPYRPNVQPPGGPNGNGRSFGHPHFMTFDRQDFDFQAVGELVLTRSTIDDLELQIRLERINSNFQDFTIITAAAMSVNGDAVVFEEDRGSPENIPTLKINGTSTNLPAMGAEPMALPGGGTITRSGRTFIVDWPDGKNRVDVRQSATEMGILAEPMLSTDYAGNLEGLLGNMDGNTENDFTTRDGTVLIPPLSFEELYREFGDSWRITQEESLFGTETFENLNIPTEQVTTDDMDPAAVSEAKSVCADFGITDPILLDNCTFDIAQTGDERFAIDTRELVTPVAKEQVSEFLSDTDSKIQVVLDAAPAGGEEFSFSGSGEIGDFTLTDDGNSSTVTYTDAFPSLPVNSYEITQQLPNEDDWVLTDISCSAEQGITTDLDNGSVTIDLTEGDVIRCAFKNIGRPSPVTLKKPIDVAVVEADSVLFTWQEGEPQIDQYQFELATDETFTSVQVDSVLTDTSIVLKELEGQNTYWWRVRAQNDVGLGEYSDPRRFSLMPTSVEPPAGIPNKYELSQNYPNPFNPSTVIDFALPEPGNVELIVYNILGRKVATLVSERKQAGYHQVTFDAGNLASGVYIYRLRTNKFEKARQLTLIK